MELRKLGAVLLGLAIGAHFPARAEDPLHSLSAWFLENDARLLYVFDLDNRRRDRVEYFAPGATEGKVLATGKISWMSGPALEGLPDMGIGAADWDEGASAYAFALGGEWYFASSSGRLYPAPFPLNPPGRVSSTEFGDRFLVVSGVGSLSGVGGTFVLDSLTGQSLAVGDVVEALEIQEPVPGARIVHIAGLGSVSLEPFFSDDSAQGAGQPTLPLIQDFAEGLSLASLRVDPDQIFSIAADGQVYRLGFELGLPYLEPVEGSILDTVRFRARTRQNRNFRWQTRSGWIEISESGESAYRVGDGVMNRLELPKPGQGQRYVRVLSLGDGRGHIAVLETSAVNGKPAYRLVRDGGNRWLTTADSAWKEFVAFEEAPAGYSGVLARTSEGELYLLKSGTMIRVESPEPVMDLARLSSGQVYAVTQSGRILPVEVPSGDTAEAELRALSHYIWLGAPIEVRAPAEAVEKAPAPKFVGIASTGAPMLREKLRSAALMARPCSSLLESY